MYQESGSGSQSNMFSNTGHFLNGKSKKMFEDQHAWYNQFRSNITCNINESHFSVLYSKQNGCPNYPIRVLVAMMVLKEASGLSDEKLFEECRFNLAIRSALGLLNMDDPVPTDSTYYLFRKKVAHYAEEEGINLFDQVFEDLTRQQCLEFKVTGKRIRMDSKLLGSNISSMSRYELVHETIRAFYKKAVKSQLPDQEVINQLDDIECIKGQKVVFTQTSSETEKRLHALGELMYYIIHTYKNTDSKAFQVLKQVFEQQFEVHEDREKGAGSKVTPRDKTSISAKSIQSPHDTDCDYRNKDGTKVKGYNLNITETCDDPAEAQQETKSTTAETQTESEKKTKDPGKQKPLRLITRVKVRKASQSDSDSFIPDIEASSAITGCQPTDTHTDGAYHSPANQAFISKNQGHLHLHAIQGAQGRFQLSYDEQGSPLVFDREQKNHINCDIIKCINGSEKWRISLNSKYRYFTQNEINNSLIRIRIAGYPIEELQKRNNVEATVFQMGYHYRNNKSRYRGQVKHQMWANMRAAWINFKRIFKHAYKNGINLLNLSEYWLLMTLSYHKRLLIGQIPAKLS